MLHRLQPVSQHTVCGTSTLPCYTNAGAGEAGVAQTLLSVLWQDAVPDIVIRDHNTYAGGGGAVLVAGGGGAVFVGGGTAVFGPSSIFGAGDSALSPDRADASVAAFGGSRSFCWLKRFLGGVGRVF